MSTQGAAFQFQTAGFEAAMADLAKHSTRTDFEIITMNAGQMLRSIAFNSPRRSGNMNAGWRPAWHRLEIPGTPNTRRSQPHTKNGRTYVPAGGYHDARKARGEKSFTFINSSHMLDPIKGRVNYPYIVAARTQFMRRAEKEVAAKFQRLLERKYRKLLGRG